MFYNKKLIRKSINAVTKSRQETRDAIIWEVLPTQRLCKIKIQGSTNFLYARYPQNWQNTPTFLKAGNAVRVMHRGGNHNVLEIVSHGMNVPTFPDSTDVPVTVGSTNAVLTGLDIYPIYGSMRVEVSSGTFRINAVTYSAAGLILGNSYNDMVLGDNTVLGEIVAVISLTAPSAGYYRYSILVIGVDGVVDLVNGTQATTNPVMPTTTAGHVKIGHILLYGGMTEITAADINKLWETPIPNALNILPTAADLEFPALSKEITITVKDQNNLSLTGNWSIRAVIEGGNGSLSGSEAITELIGGIYGGSSRIFTYYRDGLVTDISPKIRFSLIGYETTVYGYSLITIYDEFGDIMI